MKLGVLDIGSNSAQLQIVDVHPGAPPLPTHAVKEPTLLGESFEDDGSIDEAGIERVVEAVREAMAAARRFSVEQLFAFATSAVRDAANREQIVERIAAEVGIKPQFLSGEDEARLTYLAVHRWYGWSAGRLLVIDIGGGSMEIVLGRDAEPDVAVSLPLGAARLTRGFLPDDPPSAKQLKEMRRHVRDTLREVSDRLRWEAGPRRAVGTSKTFKQLARLAGAPPQRKGPFARRTLNAEDLSHWIPRLAKLSAEERARLRGISAPRAKQILAGAIVARATMGALDVAEVSICPWALREGIMLHYLQSTLDDTWALPLQPLEPGAEPADAANVHPLPRRTTESGV
jgi:exopolyphosphatase/guanosine-5'-triphosphate,3'-diphosphate pyrophosphatase